ncbi:MAG: complex I NDUFA9 subunit family protein [Elusimicrobia bacterium HGW-Elusimicrobia-3]|nr:MAG: complex I NDUFA9 subunit family protein [Elusimicrobia bacterium HGW-Elusimicrobia-3]
MRILLTGATGFVGGHVAAALAAGNRVLAPARGAGGSLPPGVERLPFSEDLAGLVAAQRPDAVVNLLGIISGDFDLVHVEYTRRLLAGAAAAGVKKFVQMSALGASESSPSAYQRSKAAAEKLVAASGIPYAIARPSLIAGAGQKLTARLAAAARWTPVLAAPAGLRVAPVPVASVAACFRRLAEDPAAAGIYELAGEREMSMREYFSESLLGAGLRRLVLPVPRALFLPLVPLFALLPDPPLTLDQYRMMAADNVPSGNFPGVKELLGGKP